MPLRTPLLPLACALLTLWGCEREESATVPAPQAAPRASEEPVTPAAGPADANEEPARYVGRQRCGGCHAAEVAAHAGSHHDRALELPTRASVAAPFEGERLKTRHLKARFVQRDGSFFIQADRAYPVKWTFGVAPLQQYLVEMDDGRVQAFPAPFDTRPAEQGGQRWYMQPELDVPAGDALHWHGLAMNWNQTCADCHSTHLQKNYLPDEDRYDTRFAELDVSCEACHGPASRHVTLAEREDGSVQRQSGFERQLPLAASRRWVREPDERIAHLEGRPESDQLEACAPCHSRRSDLGGDSPRFHDRYRLEWIEPPLYFADGQIREEVYVHGSFLQSKMARAGVVCSDCHDPHSARLRAEPQALCARCHDPGQFDVPAHHMHPPSAKRAPGCVDCHMPERTYMGIDARRDHRLGVPRPDLSEALGTPHACQGCHAERDADWAAAAIAAVHGEARPASPWPLLDALERAPDEATVRAVSALVGDGDEAAVVRGSALLRWSRAVPATPELLAAIEALASARDPLLRRAAAEASRALPPEPRLAVLTPLWRDARRVVRMEAAMAHLEGAEGAGGGGRAVPPAFLSALREARDAHLQQSDTPQGLLALGSIEMALGEPEQALAHLEEAAARFPYSEVVFANWADGLRALGKEGRAGEALERGLALHPRSAPLHHALGLWLVRSGRKREALAELHQAVQLADEGNRAHFEFVYEVARRDLGTATKP